MKPNMNMDPAPVVLFVFARPDHTRRTLEALAANPPAEQSDLIVYADAARSPGEEERVEEVRSLVRGAAGFKSVRIIERETNYGIARNIIEGVTAVCGEYGRVIVVEDDIVTSPHFLTFMNAALDKYADEKKVWHVSGWNYPIEADGLEDAFFWRAMNCWGWATWADRWRHFDRNPARLIDTWDKEKIDRFNLDGTIDFWAQVLANHRGKINTWAIFWYATIFERNGLCLNPVNSLVENIGHDGSGEHCDVSDIFSPDRLSDGVEIFPEVVAESSPAVEKIKSFSKRHKGSFVDRLASLARRIKDQP